MNLDLLNRIDSTIDIYKECVQSNGFNILNKISSEFATRVTTTTSTILDHIITDEIIREYNFLVDDIFFSDHKYLVLTFNYNLKSTLQNENVTKSVLCYDRLEKHNLWENLENMNTFNDLITNLLRALDENKIQITFKKKTTMGYRRIMLINKGT